MSQAHGYRKKDYKRACDCCGTLWFFSELKYVGQNRWFCPDDAPGLTAEAIARHNGRVPPLLVRQVKHPRPATQTPTYLDDEASIFRLVLDQWDKRSTVSITGAGTITTSADRAGRVGMYLAELIQEDERPSEWMTQARTTLRAIADFIITQQYGSSTGPSPAEATNSLLYGMIQQSGTSASGVDTTQAYCGLTLIRAYLILGDTKYLDAANNAAWFLRQALQQCQVGVSSSGTTTIYVGGFLTSMSAVKTRGNGFNVTGAGCLWFLAELRAVVGGSTVYGTATPGGDFVGSAAGSLDTMISEALAFYVGNKISGFLSPLGTGPQGPMSMLSVATPRASYTAGSGYVTSLSNGQYFVGVQAFALAMRGVFAASGYSAVADIYEWLMSFTTNPQALPPDGTSTFTLMNSAYGTYDPNIAPCMFIAYASASGNATTLTLAESPLSQNDGYDFTAASLLAPIRIASGRDLRLTKDTLSPARRRAASNSDKSMLTVYPRLVGGMGLSGQMSFFMNEAGSNWAAPLRAALVGSVYRYAPKATPNVRTS
jgi:hypothetical protein